MNSKPRAAWVAAITLILLVGYPALQAPEAIAPSHAEIDPSFEGGVRGTVRSSAGGSLGGVFVRAVAGDGSEAGGATTQADGAYAIGLKPGTYTLRFAARAHADHNASIVVSGAVVANGSATLNHTGPVLRGVVRDADTGRSLQGAVVEWSSGYRCAPDQPCILEGSGGSRPAIYQVPLSTATGPDGRYALGVETGHIDLYARMPGYRDAYLGLDVQGDATQDFRLQAIPPKTAVLEGTVRDARSGEPVPGAWLSAWPTTIAKPMPSDAGDATVVSDCVDEQGNLAPCPEKATYCCAEGNSTQADKDGRYRMDMHPGTYMMSVSATGYGTHTRVVTLRANETTRADVELPRIPPDSVVVRGEVRDARTGEALQGAWVSLENQAWGHYNGTSTDGAGRFEFRTKPGWTLVWVRHDGHGYGYAVAQPAAVEPAAGGDAAGGEASNPSSAGAGGAQGSEEPASSGIREPGPPRGTGDSYYSWVRGLDLEEDQRVSLDVALEPKPRADVRIVGYVVNASSKKAIAGASVNVHNEDTGDWGHATTHEDGSFVILGRGGMHTVHAWAEGHHGNAAVVKVEGPETRVDLHLRPGQQHGHCCIVYAEGRAASADGSEAPPAAPAPGQAAEPQSASASLGRGQGPASYEATGEKLGPYDAASAPPAGQGKPAEQPRLTPGPALALAALALLGAALARRP